MSKEKTTEQVRTELLNHIRHLINYWDNVDERNSKAKLEGLAFSILSALDGCSGGLPGFIVGPISSEEDKQYYINNDQDYYPINDETKINCDISGCLHDLL